MLSVSKFEPMTTRIRSTIDTRTTETRKFAIKAYKPVSTDRQNINQNVTSRRVLKTSEVESADGFFLFHFKDTRRNAGHKIF